MSPMMFPRMTTSHWEVWDWLKRIHPSVALTFQGGQSLLLGERLLRSRPDWLDGHAGARFRHLRTGLT